MKLIVGLGNPGPKYERTRHNAGFMVVDRVARELGTEFNRNRFEAETAETRRGGEQLLLVKPQTYMNLSGRSVGSAAAFFKVPLSEILVVHDELDLAFGAVRFKNGGGAAGHNGLKSIGAQLGNDFPRLRIGIGKPQGPQETVDYVLQAYPAADQAALDEQIALAAGGVLLWIDRGLEWAMNETHRAQKK